MGVAHVAQGASLTCLALWTWHVASRNEWAPQSWALVSMSIWTAYIIARGTAPFTSYEVRNLVWAVASMLTFMGLVAEGDFRSWADVYFFCGRDMSYCTSSYRWNGAGWRKAVVLWNFVLSAALGVQRLLVSLLLGGLLPGEDVVTRESFVSVAWRLVPYWLNNWEHQWGAECSSMIFELPHFALELLVVLPCVQILCGRLRVLGVPRAALPLPAEPPVPPPRDGAGQDPGPAAARVRDPETWVPDVLRCAWTADARQMRFLPRLRANSRAMLAAAVICVFSLSTALLVPLALEAAVTRDPRARALAVLGPELAALQRGQRLADFSRWYRANVDRGGTVGTGRPGGSADAADLPDLPFGQHAAAQETADAAAPGNASAAGGAPGELRWLWLGGALEEPALPAAAAAAARWLESRLRQEREGGGGGEKEAAVGRGSGLGPARGSWKESLLGSRARGLGEQAALFKQRALLGPVAEQERELAALPPSSPAPALAPASARRARLAVLATLFQPLLSPAVLESVHALPAPQEGAGRGPAPERMLALMYAPRPGTGRLIARLERLLGGGARESAAPVCKARDCEGQKEERDAAEVLAVLLGVWRAGEGEGGGGEEGGLASALPMALFEAAGLVGRGEDGEEERRVEGEEEKTVEEREEKRDERDEKNQEKKDRDLGMVQDDVQDKVRVVRALRSIQKLFAAKLRSAESSSPAAPFPVASLAGLYGHLSKHSAELSRMLDPEHAATFPLLELALSIMRLSCEHFFTLLAAFVAWVLWREPPPWGRRAVALVARTSTAFQRAILLVFPAVCWAYGAGVVFSAFVSVVFWTAPLLSLLAHLRAASCSMQPAGWAAATAHEVERMDCKCPICWGAMEAHAAHEGGAGGIPQPPASASQGLAPAGSLPRAASLPPPASSAAAPSRGLRRSARLLASVGMRAGAGGGALEDTADSQLGVRALGSSAVSMGPGVPEPPGGEDASVGCQSRLSEAATAPGAAGSSASQAARGAEARAEVVPPTPLAPHPPVHSAPPLDEVPMALGVCRHAYHRGCVLQWLHQCAGQGRPAVCPMCAHPIPGAVTYHWPRRRAREAPPPPPPAADDGGLAALVMGLVNDARLRWEVEVVAADGRPDEAWEDRDQQG